MKTSMVSGELYRNYNLERVCKDAIYEQLEMTPELEEYLLEEYEFSINCQFGMLGMWLGKTYEEDYERVRDGLATFQIEGLDMRRQVVCLPIQRLVLVIFFPMPDRRQYMYFQRKVQNEWSLFAPESSVFVAERCTGLSGMSTTLRLIMEQLDWNLVVGSRVLINSERIKGLNFKPLKYPKELDGEVEKALLHKNAREFEVCFKKLWEVCRRDVHTPEAIKTVCMRYALVIAHIARIQGEAPLEIEAHRMIKRVVNAVYWRDIWEAFIEFAAIMMKSNEKEKVQSLLVIKARALMKQYYSTGITLEEVADKLHISDEYLSTLFKKETGVTFSETIRGYRIERVKELLKTSRLKINEIAGLAGYSDAKYMSRVFKEEVGMSPNEYRKSRAR